MDINNANMWEELLSNLCVPDTVTVRKATEIVQQSMQNPSSFLMLFQLVQSSKLDQVRHLAAILCRRSVHKHWQSTPPELQEEIKSISFQLVTQDSTPRPVRKSVADIIARIMQQTPQWNGFLDTLIQLVKSTDPSHRDTGLYLFQTLIDSDELRAKLIIPNTDSILEIIAVGLNDANQDVRIRSLACANAFLNHIHQEDPIVTKYIQLLPAIIKVINFSVEDSDDRVSVGFEILSTLTEDFMGHLQPMVPDLLRFTLTVSANSTLEASLRSHALYFIEFIIENKPKSFLANACLQDVIQLCFLVMTESESEDEEENTLRIYGSQIIDVLALEIPSKYIWQPIMERVTQFIQSPRAIDRKAAITAVTVISEGCSDRVEENIDQIMPWIIAGLKDERLVRQSSLVAISELAKNLAAAIEPYHEHLVPLLLKATTDEADIICIKAFYAISHYMNFGDPEALLPHLDVLLKHMMSGLNHQNMEVKELALNALSSVVSMAREKFEPYFTETIVIMKNWMAIVEPNSLFIRNQATECISMLAGAVRREIFIPHFQDVVGIAITGLESIDDAEVREFIYRFFEQIARVYAEELSPYYPQLLPYLLASCESSDGLVYVNDDDGFNLFPDTMQEPIVNQELTLRVLSSYMDEKAAAASCLGWLIAENSEASASYLEASVNMLAGLSIFDLYPPVASSAIVSLVQSISGMLSLLDENFAWKKGETSPIPAPVQNALELLFIQYTKIMDLEDQTIVRAAIESIGKLALMFGPVAVIGNMATISNWICSILMQRAKFQVNRESFEENEEDFETFNVVLNVMVELAKTCGSLFVPFLPDLFNCFSSYFGDESPEEYKECCLCTIVEVAEEIENDFLPFCDAFLAVSMRAMNENSDENIIQYACACIRVVLLYGKVTETVANEIWTRVNSLMESDASQALVFDCLYGLMAQLVLSFPSLRPVDQILPLLVRNLPLRVNAEPSSVIYQCIFRYLEAGNATLLGMMGQIIELFVVEISIGDITEECKAKQTNFLQNLATTQRELLDAVFNNVLQKQIVDPPTLMQLRNIL